MKKPHSRFVRMNSSEHSLTRRVPLEWTLQATLKSLITLITWKLTVKDLGPISIISSILPCTSKCVPSKALMIIMLDLIRDISTFRRSRVTIGQTFKVNPLSINTLAIIMSSYLTTICMAKVWSLPSGGNLSSENETWSVTNTNDTMPLKEESIILVGTCVSFNRASWWTSKDSNRAKIKVWTIDFFNC